MNPSPLLFPQSSISQYSSSIEHMGLLGDADMQHHSMEPRPAVYIKVMDLAQSYNIDPEKIKVEIEKINIAKCESGEEKTATDAKEDSHSTVSKVTDDSDLSGEKRQGSTFPKGHPKRFSAINGGFNLCLLVGKVTVVVDKLRVDKSRVRLAEVEVGDETGSISLRARDTQIDEIEKVAQEGGAIVLRNSSIELYQGKHLRLAVTKWGKISSYPDNIPSTPIPPTRINTDWNLSIVDLNVVSPDVWIKPPTPPYSQKSGDSTSRRSMSPRQHSQHHDHHQSHYRKKDRGNNRDRRYQSQQGYMQYDRSHTQNYSPMHNMMSAYSSMYPGAQYYHNYGDTPMQGPHQTQQMHHQKHQSAQQQLLLMQQQHFHLQQQMEQMEKMLYSRNGEAIDQSSPNRFSGPYTETQSHDLSESAGNMIAQQIYSHHQSQLGDQDERRNPQNRDSSSVGIEAPVSPQMNPNAVAFAPHYNIPDLNSGLQPGQQQYFMQATQTSFENHYNNRQYYPSHADQTNRQDKDKQR